MHVISKTAYILEHCYVLGCRISSRCAQAGLEHTALQKPKIKISSQPLFKIRATLPANNQVVIMINID